MPYIKYIDKTFRAPALARIDQVNEIIAEYEAEDMRLTLRQLYYQLVARGLIPNTQAEYDKLGNLLGNARLAGLVDWDAIEDRGRTVARSSAWESPAGIIEMCSEQYKRDLWYGQTTHVEVWIEKEALFGVIAPICRALRVNHFACKGHTSLSALWEAGQRLLEHAGALQKPVVIHLGDYDPSGIDMTRDIQERLTRFVGLYVEVKRIALNSDQVKKYNPPPNPAKATDSRFAEYAEKHGTSCWELDALEPKLMARLIKAAVMKYVNKGRRRSEEKREKIERAQLASVAKRWDDVVELLNE